MSREFPDWVNPWAAAEGRRIFSGTLPLVRMKRLSTLLADAQGEAEFRAAFTLDTERRPVIELQVCAHLPLVCQASLEVYREAVERTTRLGVVRSGDELDLLPEHYEPVRLENGRLAIQDLVEDELLLGMPQIPRRPGLDPVSYLEGDLPQAETRVDELRKPFAQLGELMRKGQRGNEAD